MDTSSITLNRGDKATVTRGRIAGELVEVIDHNPADDSYAVKVVGTGKFSIVNRVSLKAPDEARVTVRALLSTLRDAGVLEDDRIVVALEKIGINTDEDPQVEATPA